MRAFVAVLEAAPAAYITGKNAVEVGLAEHDVAKQRLESGLAIQQKPAFAVVLAGPHDCDVLASRLSRDRLHLALGRINLAIGGNPNVCDGTQRLGRIEVFGRHGRLPELATPDRR